MNRGEFQEQAERFRKLNKPKAVRSPNGIKSGPRFTATQREYNRAYIADSILKGRPVTEIASHLDVSIATVYKELKTLRERWKEVAAEALDQRKAFELAKLEKLETTYWEAYERSTQVFTKKMQRQKAGIKGQPTTEATLVEEERVGDPRFLDGILKCIQQRCQMTGLNDPEKVLMLGQVSITEVKNELDKRMEKYAEVFAIPSGQSETEHPVLDGAGQPVDTDGAARETGDVLDTTGRVR